MNEQSIFLSSKLTDRSLIESIVSSFYIVDYGFIKNINSDGTVDVAHAKQLVTTTGKELPATITTKIEMLTISGAGFSLKLDYAKGDKVLLLGLKDQTDNVGDIDATEPNKSRHHYDRATLKALPLCVFNDDSKVKIEIDSGEMSITSDKLKLNGEDKAFVTWDELNTALQNLVEAINLHTHTSATSGSPTSAPVTPMSLNISDAKTTTVVTGG